MGMVAVAVRTWACEHHLRDVLFGVAEEELGEVSPELRVALDAMVLVIMEDDD